MQRRVLQYDKVYIYIYTQPSKSSCVQVRNILNLPAKLSILLFKGLPLFGLLIFKFKNVPTPLCLSRDKAKE